MDQHIVDIVVAIITITLSLLTAGGGVAVIVLRALREVHHSPVLMQAIEALYASQPAAAQELEHEAASLVDDATDGDGQITPKG